MGPLINRRVTKIVALVFIFIIALSGIVAYYALREASDISKIIISTDKKEYHIEDTVYINISNTGASPINIYCPMFCELGNFPTTVQKLTGTKWEYYSGFCPSIDPILGNGEYEGEYISHKLDGKSSFTLAISNFRSMGKNEEIRLRIVYYIGVSKTSIFSNEFTMK
jgi:hypothetical protein